MSKALFIHHSIGRQILDEGRLREKLAASVPSLTLWDHDYNERGLSDGSGSPVGRSFPIPGDDTDPEGLLRVLEGVRDANPWSADLRTFDLVVLKSCFPNNAIRSDEAAEQLRDTYRRLREIALELPQAVVLVSSPPLVFEATRPDQAARAVRLAEWLTAHWTGPRLAYVNLLDALAYRSGPARGTLRLRYRVLRRGDSHLSPAGAEAGARALVPGLRAVA